MKFHCLQQDLKGSYAYKLNIDQTNILFAGGIPIDPLLRYSPFEHDKNIQISQKKIIKEQKQNPFYHIIQDSPYIKGKIQFDLSFLQYANIQEIDILLISSLEDLFLLPFLFCHKKFKAKIFSTVPIKQAGLYLVKDFKNLLDQRNKMNLNQQKGLFFDESEFLDLFEDKYGYEIQDWHDLFSNQDVQRAFDAIIDLNHRKSYKYLNIKQQKYKFDQNLEFEPLSSGYSLGSSMWIIRNSGKKILCISNASIHKHRHPTQFDIQQLNKYSETSPFDSVIVMHCLNTSNLQNNQDIIDIKTTNQELLVLNFINQIQFALKQSSQTIFLVPLKNLVILLDLLDVIKNKLNMYNLKLLVLGEQLIPLIRFGNANVEYLNPLLHQKIYANDPQEPFSTFHTLQKNNILSSFKDITELQQFNAGRNLVDIIQHNAPCLYFILDYTMRFGLAEKFLQLFEQTTFKNKYIVLTDPDLQDSEVFKPFKDSSTSKVLYSPLDTRCTLMEFKTHILDKICYSSLIIPEQYSILDFKQQIVKYYKDDQQVTLPFIYNNTYHQINKNIVQNLQFKQKNSLNLCFGYLTCNDKQQYDFQSQNQYQITKCVIKQVSHEIFQNQLDSFQQSLRANIKDFKLFNINISNQEFQIQLQNIINCNQNITISHKNNITEIISPTIEQTAYIKKLFLQDFKNIQFY